MLLQTYLKLRKRQLKVGILYSIYISTVELDCWTSHSKVAGSNPTEVPSDDFSLSRCGKLDWKKLHSDSFICFIFSTDKFYAQTSKDQKVTKLNCSFLQFHQYTEGQETY